MNSTTLSEIKVEIKPDEFAELRARVVALEPLVGVVEALKQRVEALEAASLIADEDKILRQELRAIAGKPFRSAHLAEFAEQHHPRLAEALKAARLSDTDAIGTWLRDSAGVRDGVAIIRKGRWWRIEVLDDTSDT